MKEVAVEMPLVLKRLKKKREERRREKRGE